MKKVLVTIVLALATAACNPVSYPLSDERAGRVVKEMKYAKDERTGLCYGIIGTAAGIIDFGSLSVTNVPCEKVEARLVK